MQTPSTSAPQPPSPKRKAWFYPLIILSIVLSLGLLYWVFSRLDWDTFYSALVDLNWLLLLPAIALIILNIASRAWRWCWVSGESPRRFIPFWQSTSIGYFGNIIYPARAGEILRMFAIHYFAGLKGGHAMSSAFLDRLFDMLMLGLLVLALLGLRSLSNEQSSDLNEHLGYGALVLMGIAATVLLILLRFVNVFIRLCQSFEWQKHWLQKLQQLCLHGLEGLHALRSPSRLLVVFLLTALAFALDSFTKWQVMQAFGFDLPFSAGMLCVAFILLGISVPSLPGHIGIYQIACIFALSFYGIGEAQALAFSIVMQLMEFAVIATQGLLVVFIRGFDMGKARHAHLES